MSPYAHEDDHKGIARASALVVVGIENWGEVACRCQKHQIKFQDCGCLGPEEALKPGQGKPRHENVSKKTPKILETFERKIRG
ncbi:hypothetical protein [Planktothrix sp.]|jgi:hypothetical protein|uniref:hypothetical protein n=1 Tax=Planktothrix sp. TaxID=3088171 RepID=UPI0038D486D5